MFRAAPPHHTMGSIARWENNKPQQLFWQPQLGPFATSLVTTSAGQQLGYWGGLGAFLLKTSLSEKNRFSRYCFRSTFFFQIRLFYLSKYVCECWAFLTFCPQFQCTTSDKTPPFLDTKSTDTRHPTIVGWGEESLLCRVWVTTINRRKRERKDEGNEWEEEKTNKLANENKPKTHIKHPEQRPQKTWLCQGY